MSGCGHGISRDRDGVSERPAVSTCERLQRRSHHDWHIFVVDEHGRRRIQELNGRGSVSIEDASICDYEVGGVTGERLSITCRRDSISFSTMSCCGETARLFLSEGSPPIPLLAVEAFCVHRRTHPRPPTEGR